MDDISNILFKSLSKFKSGEIYNLSDDKPSTSEEVTLFGAKILNIENIEKIEVDQIKSEMLKNFYNESKKVSNKKMKSYFNYDLNPKLNFENFYVSRSNKEAYEFVFQQNKLIKNSIIYGPNKSGKSHLGRIWQDKYNAIYYDKKISKSLLKINKNVFIDNFFVNLDEENIFHLINHCSNNNLKILICANKYLYEYNFKIKDLLSRLQLFNFIKINQPDDEMIANLIMKLLFDKQIIINQNEVIPYILKRINRTYEDVYLFVEKIDNLSLEKKRELTIPLVKELI